MAVRKSINICGSGPSIEAAVQGYASDVRSRAFPGPEHVYEMKKS